MTDLIILGNGMAGMTAALYAARANLNFKIVGKDEFNFGQIGNAILVENYPCSESLSGFDLAMKLYNQLEDNGITIEEHTVEKVMRENDGTFSIKYTDGTIDHSKTVIYALGASHRKLNCEIDKRIPIHYCALCDGNLYKDKYVAVIGGGDSAFTQAEYLSSYCYKIFIIMCDKNITAFPETFKRVSKLKNVKIVYDFPVDEILYASSSCSHCQLISNKQDNHFHVDGIFVAIGMKPNTQSIISPSFPIITDTFGYIMADENGRTAVDGFFAAGDVRQKQLRQSITAASDGANAVQSVIQYLQLKR